MSKFFINRSIVAMVISIILVIVGLVTMIGLPVAQFPKVVPPEIFIQANYVGADAQTIEQSVATPIEQQMSGVDNMNYMYSVNANNGLMRLFVNFDLKTDPNIDHVLTQLRYAQAESQLPADVRNYGVTVQKSLSAPFILVALNSPKGTRDAQFLANYAYINLTDSLSRVPGISQVTVFGAGQYAMRIWVKPDQLAGSNAIDTANAVKKLMAELKDRFPADLDYHITIDTTRAVVEGIREIGKTFWEALALVMLVVFIFLQGWRAAMIPLMAVPVS